MTDPFAEPIVDLALGPVSVIGSESKNLLIVVLPLIVALVISMVIIPVMVRLAPVFGMIDQPGKRKIHAVSIPRVGGVGIFLGAITPIVLLLPLESQLYAFLVAALVLFGFGVLDDCRELGHYVKFIGQFIAVLIIVYGGDVFVVYLPFMNGEPMAESIGRPFTVFAMVGMINAINHSDGLDGLAGGESLLSLACIAWLSWLADGVPVTIIAIAVIGGLFGFMRFNTYPARIFMGDGGSQFLGLVLGYLTVLLTQQVNPALSPALPALILGLPIADIIAVFAQRVYHRMNWFRATRNHIHHRLLDLGFQHYESVVTVYSVQAMLVLAAVLMPYQSDGLIIGVYLTVVGILFLLLYIAEGSGWQLHKVGDVQLSEIIKSATVTTRLSVLGSGLVFFGISLFLVAGSAVATRIPPDFAVAATALAVVLLIRLLLGYRIGFLPLRPLLYVTIVFIVYLANIYQPAYLAGADPFTYIFFGGLIAGIWLSVRFSGETGFAVNPLDFLVVLAVLVLAVLSQQGLIDLTVTAVTLKSIIMFYGCELILNRMKRRWNFFTISALVSLLVVSVRGLITEF